MKILNNCHISESEKTDGSVLTCFDQSFSATYRWMKCKLVQINCVFFRSINTYLVRTLLAKITCTRYFSCTLLAAGRIYLFHTSKEWSRVPGWTFAQGWLDQDLNHGFAIFKFWKDHFRQFLLFLQKQYNI